MNSSDTGKDVGKNRGKKPQKDPQKIVIGTRGSDMALKQANMVAAALKAADPAIMVEVRVIVTHGDVNQSPIPLDTVGKGWFTKEIEQELIGGTIDIAVHSLKDLGVQMPPGLMLAAYLPRQDARDALITKNGESLETLRPGTFVGTDSPRRQAQMLAIRPDLKMKSLRGNVPTRLRKLDGTFRAKNGQKQDEKQAENQSETYDAIILAVAGLQRLGLEDRIAHIFEPDEMTPAPGQGIVAVQIREDNAPVKKILAGMSDVDTAHVADLERSFARATGAGCKSPTGAYAFRDGDICRLVGMIAMDDGTNIVRGEVSAPWSASAGLGEKLAKELLVKLGESGEGDDSGDENDERREKHA